MERARTLVRKALADAPGTASLKESAIDLSILTGRPDEALQLVDESMKQLARKEWWHAKRAAVLARAGRMREAQQECAHATEAIAALPDRLRETRAVGQLAADIAALARDAAADKAENFSPHETQTQQPKHHEAHTLHFP
jgi:predicted Zn-dependent protease